MGKEERLGSRVAIQSSHQVSWKKKVLDEVIPIEKVRENEKRDGEKGRKRKPG